MSEEKKRRTYDLYIRYAHPVQGEERYGPKTFHQRVGDHRIDVAVRRLEMTERPIVVRVTDYGPLLAVRKFSRRWSGRPLRIVVANTKTNQRMAYMVGGSGGFTIESLGMAAGDDKTVGDDQ